MRNIPNLHQSLSPSSALKRTVQENKDLIKRQIPHLQAHQRKTVEAKRENQIC